MTGGRDTEWFLQLNGEQRGPFPSWQISRYLMLQRLNPQSLVSRDGANWRPIGELTELQPERRLAIADLPKEERQRLEATAGWIEDHPELFKLTGAADEAIVEHHAIEPKRRQNRILGYGMVGLLLLGVVAIPYLIPAPPEVAEPQCDAVAAPGVNWSNCRLRGSYLAGGQLRGAMLRNANLSSSDLTSADLVEADLAYANLALSEMRSAQLQNARLKGANLRNVNLRGANLEGADLSYADLTGALLEGANLTNTRFGYALWEENVSCMPESVGRCIPARSTR